ncbi:MAG: hypothetical protein IKI82_01435 [Lachnospiraceae bacterium]|nr:hypothetical protein [Lachnospiraceae bacterium]
MKRFLRLLLLYLLLTALPFGVFAAAVRTEADPFENSFEASLRDKYDRLASLPGARLVFIGGSSLPFGLRSARLEKTFGLPAADFGVYAALGTRVMAEIALPLLHEGDIVVLAPETDPQTYSNYFNADVLWEAVGDRTEMLRPLSLPEREEMFLRRFKYAAERKWYEGTSLAADRLYSRDSFDEYGDISFPREGNVMPGGFDKSRLISLDGLIDTDFFAFVRTFAAVAGKKGAAVYFTFAPMNGAAVRFSGEEETAFLARLREELPGMVLGTPSDTVYPAEYFYNTNYHLNDEGAALHTETLIRLLADAGLRRREEDPGPPPESTESPEPTSEDSSSAAETLPFDPNEAHFRIEEIGGSLFVTGLTEEGKAEKALTLPESAFGQPVTGIASFALEGCRAESLRIPACYRFFDSWIFEDCGTLSRIELLLRDPSSSYIPTSGLFDGCAPDLTVAVPADCYTAYISDYNWRLYRDLLVPEESLNGGAS